MLALWHSHVPQGPCVLSASWSWARRSGAHSLEGPRGWGWGFGVRGRQPHCSQAASARAGVSGARREGRVATCRVVAAGPGLSSRTQPRLIASAAWGRLRGGPFAQRGLRAFRTRGYRNGVWVSRRGILGPPRQPFPRSLARRPRSLSQTRTSRNDFPHLLEVTSQRPFLIHALHLRKEGVEKQPIGARPWRLSANQHLGTAVEAGVGGEAVAAGLPPRSGPAPSRGLAAAARLHRPPPHCAECPLLRALPWPSRSGLIRRWVIVGSSVRSAERVVGTGGRGLQ